MFQLEEELRDRLELWEQAQGQAFLVNGQRFMEHVAEQWQLHHLEKEREKQERVSERVASGPRLGWTRLLFPPRQGVRCSSQPPPPSRGLCSRSGVRRD